MKRFFVDKSQINNNQIVLDGTEHNHLKNVLRCHEDEHVIVVCGDEFDYECKIVKIAKNNTLLEIVKREKNIYNPTSDVTFFQALTKSENMNLIVQKLNELGVKTFVPFESRYITSKDKINKSEKLQLIANQSSKQCKRSIPMKVMPTLSFSKLIETLPDYDCVVFANETENQKSFNAELIKPNMKVAVIVGSEGGFSEEEISALIQVGAKSISLGKRILRAETASITLASILAFLMGELGQ